MRTEADQEAGVLGLLPKGDIADVVDNSNPEWVCIDYEGADGYVAAEYVTVDFQIDSGETLEEIKAREAAEREATSTTANIPPMRIPRSCWPHWYSVKQAVKATKASWR